MSELLLNLILHMWRMVFICKRLLSTTFGAEIITEIIQKFPKVLFL